MTRINFKGWNWKKIQLKKKTKTNTLVNMPNP